MVHGKNRIPYRIHRRLTGLAGPDITPSSRLACPLSLKTPNMGNPGSVSRENNAGNIYDHSKQ